MSLQWIVLLRVCFLNGLFIMQIDLNKFEYVSY